MEILPSNFETKTNLTYGEKKFINEIRYEDSNKLFLVNIYPFSKDNNEKKGNHHCLITPKGVVLIKPLVNINKIKDINSEFLKMIIEDKRNELYNPELFLTQYLNRIKACHINNLFQLILSPIG